MRNCLILGPGRSGTSLLTGCLTRSGWWSGDDHHPKRDSNPTGFFESAWVNALNESAMRAAGIEGEPGSLWLHAGPPAGVAADAVIRDARARIGQAPFALKDPRFTWTLDGWEKALGDVAKVCIHREPTRVIRSTLRECSTQPYLARVSMDEGRAAEVWRSSYEALLSRAEGRDDWFFLSYESLLDGSVIPALSAFLGHSIDTSLVDPQLERSPAADHVPPPLLALRQRLLSRSNADRLRCEPSPTTHVEPLVAITRETRSVGPAAESPDLSVLISTYRRRDVLLRSLEAWNAQTLAGASFEVVVTDDASPDGTWDALSRIDASVPMTLCRRPLGSLASARNESLELARGRVVLIVNDDTVAPPQLVQQHLDAHHSAPRDCAVLGRFDQPEQTLTNALVRVTEHTSYGFPFEGMIDGSWYGWDKFWTCNVSVAAQHVQRIGGFDERFETYGCEDSDLGLRLERAGIPVRYHAEAKAHHNHVLDLDAQRHRQTGLARANVHFFRKHPDLLRTPQWAWMSRFQRPAMETQEEAELEALARLDAVLRPLTQVDLGGLEANGEHASARQVEADLRKLLDLANGVWWSHGVLQGLRDLGLDQLTPDQPTQAPMQALPLRTNHRTRWLAWPRWDRDAELREVVEQAVALTSSGVHGCLCLRFDPATDGDATRAIARLRTQLSRTAASRSLDVLVIDDALTPADWPRLLASVTHRLSVSSGDSARTALMRTLPATRITGMAPQPPAPIASA